MQQSFPKLIRERRSCHHFSPDFKLSDQAFFEILEDVRWTPSGYNAQPWEFLLVREETRLKNIHAIAFEQPHILTSGNIVVVLGNTDFGNDECESIINQWAQGRDISPEKLAALEASLRKGRPLPQRREMVIRNCALAAMTFLYSAEEKGFITCPMMGFSQKKLARFLELPEKIIPILMIAIGKGDPQNPEPPRLPRKEAKDIGFLEEYPNQ